MDFDHFSWLAPVYEKFIRPHISDELLRLLDASADSLILDAGGGTGRVAQFLPKGAGCVVVTDLSCRMLQQAQVKPGLQAACAPLERLPFPGAVFDRVLMVDALHHVIHQPQTVGELWRVLKPGGRLVIEEPDIDALAVKIIALGEKLAGMRSHFLNASQIESLLCAAGAQPRSEQARGTMWIRADKI